MAYNVNDGRIGGLRLSVAADGQTVGLTPGFAYIPNQGRALSQADMTVAVTGVVSAWRHFYLANDDGTLKFEASATAPSDAYQGTARIKTGDATRRYLVRFISTPAVLPWPFGIVRKVTGPTASISPRQVVQP